MDRGAWWVTVHRVTKSWTWLDMTSICSLMKIWKTRNNLKTHYRNVLEPCESRIMCRYLEYVENTQLYELPRWLSSKQSACNAGDLGSIRGSGRYPGKWHSNPLQYSCLGNPMDRGAWWATVHGVLNRVGHDLATKRWNSFAWRGCWELSIYSLLDKEFRISAMQNCESNKILVTPIFKISPQCSSLAEV